MIARGGIGDLCEALVLGCRRIILSCRCGRRRDPGKKLGGSGGLRGRLVQIKGVEGVNFVLAEGFIRCDELDVGVVVGSLSEMLEHQVMIARGEVRTAVAVKWQRSRVDPHSNHGGLSQGLSCVGARAQGWGGFGTGWGVAIVQGPSGYNRARGGLVLTLDLLVLATRTVVALRFSLGCHEI